MASYLNLSFWSSFNFTQLIIIGIIDGFIASKLFVKNFRNLKIISIIFCATIFSFFIEYYLTLIFNNGYPYFVWLPWVSLNAFYFLLVLEFLLACIILFFITIIIEFICSFFFLFKICSLFLR